MQGWGRTSSQPPKGHQLDKKVNALSPAERAQQKCARRDYRRALEKDISNLQRKLKQEVDTHKALERAFRRTLGVLPRFSPGLSPKVQELLAEVAVLEEEVINLEESIVALRQGLYNEAVYLSVSKQQKEPGSNAEPEAATDVQPNPKPVQQSRNTQNGNKAKRNSVIAKLLPPVVESKNEESSILLKTSANGEARKPFSNGTVSRDKQNSHKRAVRALQHNSNNRAGLDEDIISTPRTTPLYDEHNDGDQESTSEKENQQKSADKSSKIWPQNSDSTPDSGKKAPETTSKGVIPQFGSGESVEPNLLSEEMVWCLSSIFLRLTKQAMFADCETSSTVSHSTLSSVWSLTSRNSISFNPSRDVTEEIEISDPYNICVESDPKDIGPYQYYHEVTANSLDYSRIPRSAGFLKKLMILVEKLRTVDLRGLTHHQKLSFWINIYNSCMMHAFLEHGIPNSPHKVVALMGKAAINVGGHLLSALAIEHFILRLPCDIDNSDWKSKERESEGLMRSTYGLEWPEPLVSFALCCGSWSSPAVRIYTPLEVENELEIAKTEYLQAAVGVTQKKVVIPKILDWYMRDFAKDAESLMDWVSEQLPSSISKSMQKCLANRQGKPIPDVVEVMPYDFNFRYLFAVQPF